ncbi:MbcA/ParS/Xre antitoxin family protein (plasmid) [Rhizobium sp. 32-5/1]|uniref:MbcA/ParS/Xre antitoxin family protein n=1 Tax=Rhizobium sp. 32-5/1 TaxID=3019602 RepID=UPI00240E367F|nr:MbcA/ParS/Xre antitoxin family protein [Rhizobium sp. 32-5/1]WEZ85688.1 MbcA/ParS/Xre antitoxin family protein [Rhizobium sp. 32-5/1]
MLNVVKIGESEPAIGFKSGYGLDEVRAMQRTVLNIFDRWGVSDVDAATILGGISPKTYKRWKDEDYGRANRDLADRMSNILGIHKALRIIFAEPRTGYDWMSAKNSAFAGLTALDVMRRGSMEDIVRIRRYLDSVRGGW